MLKSKTFLYLAVALFALLAALFFLKKKTDIVSSDKALPIIAITQIATHPALDDVRKGIMEGLSDKGYRDGKTVKIVFKNANGDSSLTVPIAQEFVKMHPAVIVPISTPSALAVASSTKDIPIVFSGVTNPVSVGLVASLQNPGGNITGVTDEFPYEDQVKMFKRLFPNIKTIGMLYTKGDDVSSVGVNAMQKLSEKYNFTLKLAPVSSGTDIYPVAVSMFKNVDAIYTGIDHLILENMGGLAKAGQEAQKPLLGGESGSVKQGAVASISINMTDFGHETSKVIEKVLTGMKPGSMPVRVIDTGDLVINASAAKRFGLDVEVLKQEGAIIYSGNGN